MTTLRRRHAAAGRLTVLLVVLLCCARAVAFHPVQSPDSRAYVRMADNLRNHACISYSDPSTGACEPAWGTQPPAYPMFLATIRSFATEPWVAVALQVALFGMAALWLAWGIAPGRDGEAAAVALVICASPLTFGWSRWILTETLAAAAVMLVFGVLVRAIRTRKLPVVLTGGALVVALMLRWDLVLLLIPVAVVAIAVQQPARALASVTLASMIAVAPYGALMVRASMHHLPLTPPSPLDQDLPEGLLRFWRATALDQRATAGLIWPAWARDYPAVIRLERAALARSVSAAQLDTLLRGLARVPAGSAIPPAIDSAFGASAATVTSRHAPGVLGARAWRMWSRDDAQYLSGWQDTPVGARGWERARTAYRMALLILSALAVAVLQGPARVAAVAAFAFIIARTAFLISTPISMLETRLLTPVIPVLEAVGVLVVATVIGRVANRGVAQAPDLTSPRSPSHER